MEKVPVPSGPVGPIGSVGQDDVSVAVGDDAADGWNDDEGVERHDGDVGDEGDDGPDAVEP